MQNININNYQKATDFDINNIAEFLLTEALKYMNHNKKVVDGQMWIFMVNESGFDVVMGSYYNLLDVFKIVRQHSGRILLRATVLFNNLNSGIYEIAVMQPVNTEKEFEHIVTAKITIGTFPFILEIIKVREQKL